MVRIAKNKYDGGDNDGISIERDLYKSTRTIMDKMNTNRAMKNRWSLSLPIFYGMMMTG